MAQEYLHEGKYISVWKEEGKYYLRYRDIVDEYVGRPGQVFVFEPDKVDSLISWLAVEAEAQFRG